MDVARIQTDEVSLGRSEVSGLVTAGIWLKVNEVDFPAKGWGDFAVVVLAAWVDAVERLLRGASTHEQVHFMDGPYMVEITSARSGGWRLVLIEERQSGRRTQSATIDPRPLVESIVQASEALLIVCRERSWETTDSVRLGASIARLVPPRTLYN